MLLSLDWSVLKDEPMIVASDTKGKVHLFRLANDKIEKKLSLDAHSFEAWICAFYYWDHNIIFTGK